MTKNRYKLFSSSDEAKNIFKDFDIFKDIDLGDCIYSGRNTLIRYRFNDADFVVKYFNKSLISRFIYALRRSKARRSYENACKLIERGVDTPYPMAYVERRGLFNILMDSAYVSAYVDSQSLSQAISDGCKGKILMHFAEFISDLHLKGIMHRDLNSTNVRVQCHGEGIRFSLIDLNRMDILPKGVRMTARDRFFNLVRFSDLDLDFCEFLKDYLRASGLPTSDFKKVVIIKSLDCRKIDRLKKYKNLIKNICRK